MTHLTMRVAFWKIKSGPCCRILSARHPKS